MREGTRVPEHPIYMEQATHYRESISASHDKLEEIDFFGAVSPRSMTAERWRAVRGPADDDRTQIEAVRSRTKLAFYEARGVCPTDELAGCQGRFPQLVVNRVVSLERGSVGRAANDGSPGNSPVEPTSF